MNVIRNHSVPSRGQGRKRGQGKFPAEQINNILPKYQFDIEFRKPLLNLQPSTNQIKTPVNKRRARPPTSTSSCLSSSSRRVTTSGNQPGTTSPGSTSSATDSCIILAITSGRGDARCEVGMAAVNVRYPHMILCQISDCQTYINSLTKIFIFDPIEIIMPDTMCNRGNYTNKLYTTIREKWPNLNITPVSRIHFNERTGIERIRTHCTKEFASVELFVKQKYYALAAAAALLKYVEYIQHVLYAPKSMKIEFQGSQNATVIDVESAKALELVTSQIAKPNICLLGIMDRCSTPMGRRLLRASILQPPCKLKTIVERQACVRELVGKHSLRSVVQGIIRRLYGADRLLAMATKPIQSNNVQAAEHNLNYILLLKNSLDIVPELKAALTSGESPFFTQVMKSLDNESFQIMKEKILKIVNSESRAVKGYTSANMQRCFAIKAGLNDLLDIARQTYCELIDDMKTLVQNLSEKYKISMALGCNVSLGYHIEAVAPRNPNFKITDLPAEFIEVQKHKNSFLMTTSALLVLSQQCKISCEEVHIMSNVILTDLIEDIREHIGCLFQLSADVAELDLISSLAELSCLPNYVLPTFGTKLSLKNSMHPILLSINEDQPIPNDVEASITHNFHLITGPNMSGKSVYLKQIVLLQIMAQIGCYVPANSAEFRIADRIFCKISFCDDIECNASTFVLEIKEAQYILQSVTAKSLIILDELCRATTIEEGCSIGWGISEYLLITSAFTFCATHFTYMTKLAELYHNVINHCFETATRESEGTSKPRLIYTHRLKSGNNLLSCHGISLSEMSGIPEAITTMAREYASKEQKNKEFIDENGEAPETWIRILYNCMAQLYDLLESNKFTKENILAVLEKNLETSGSSTGIVEKRELIQNARDNIQRAIEDKENTETGKESENESQDPGKTVENRPGNRKSFDEASQAKRAKTDVIIVEKQFDTSSSSKNCYSRMTFEEHSSKSINRPSTDEDPQNFEWSEETQSSKFHENIRTTTSSSSSNLRSEFLSTSSCYQSASSSFIRKSDISSIVPTKTPSFFTYKCSRSSSRSSRGNYGLSQDPTINLTFSSNIDDYIGADGSNWRKEFAQEFSQDPNNLSDKWSMKSPLFKIDTKPETDFIKMHGMHSVMATSNMYELSLPSNAYNPSFSKMTTLSNFSNLEVTSQSSMATDIARVSARRKEANIFKTIEGENFDETEFYKSMDSVIEMVYNEKNCN